MFISADRHYHWKSQRHNDCFMGMPTACYINSPNVTNPFTRSFMFSVIHKHQLKGRREPFALNTHFIIIFSADEHFTSGLFNVGSWFSGYICSWNWWRSKLWRYRFFETKEPRGLLGTYDNRRHRSRISDLSMAHWSSTGTIYKYHVDRFQVINTPLKVNVHNSLCLQWHTLVK